MTKSPKSSKPQPKNSDSGHPSKSEERPAEGLVHLCWAAIKRIFKRKTSRPMIPTGTMASPIQDPLPLITAETPEPLGEVMRYHRKRRNLTQKQLRTRLEVSGYPYISSDSTISMWETGTRIPDDPEVFLYYGKCLHLSVEEILALGELWLVAKSREPLELYQSFVQLVNAFSSGQPPSRAVEID